MIAHALLDAGRPGIGILAILGQDGGGNNGWDAVGLGEDDFEFLAVLSVPRKIQPPIRGICKSPLPVLLVLIVKAGKAARERSLCGDAVNGSTSGVGVCAQISRSAGGLGVVVEKTGN